MGFIRGVVIVTLFIAAVILTRPKNQLRTGVFRIVNSVLKENME